MSKAIDIVGQRYGRLVVLARAGSYRGKQPLWLCRCDCGEQLVVNGTSLRRGLTQSCGCLQRERAVSSNTTHGGSRSAEWRSWSSAKGRCYNVNHPKYHHYGGRGIEMDERWRNSFEEFLADMGPRPGPEYSLERVDCDGNYSRTNCKWATQLEQQRNRRNSR